MNNLILIEKCKDFLDKYKFDFNFLREQLTEIMKLNLKLYNCNKDIKVEFTESELFGKSGDVSKNQISFNKTRLETLNKLKIDDTDKDIVLKLERFYKEYQETTADKYEKILYTFMKKYKEIGAERFFNQVGSYKTIKYDLLDTILHECQHILQDEQNESLMTTLENDLIFGFTKVCNKLHKEIKINNLPYERTMENYIFPIELDARYIALKIMVDVRDIFYQDNKEFDTFIIKRNILPDKCDLNLSADLVFKEYEKMYELYTKEINNDMANINKFITQHKEAIKNLILERYKFIIGQN